MVKVERSFPAPASLALESQKANGSYSMPDVVKQLKEDFHNKCYICAGCTGGTFIATFGRKISKTQI